ncbi:MAG: hypothetical protein ACLVFS_08855 [Butyricicoccus sp.]
MLADKLGIPFYNREIITMASEDSGVNAMLLSEASQGRFPDAPARALSRQRARAERLVQVLPQG